MGEVKEILNMIENVKPDDTEEWRELPSNYRYLISNLGRVRHIKGNIKKPYKNQGYFRVTLYNKGKSKTYKVAALVAEVFHGKRPDGYFIDHIDENKVNDRPENLEYVTPRENTRRYYKNRKKTVGVYYCKKTNRYSSQISVKFEKITLGWFDTEEEASAAYIGARKATEKWMK